MCRLIKSLFLSLCLILAQPVWAQSTQIENPKPQTIDDLKRKYPKAKVKEVSPKEYEEYKRRLNDRHNPCLAEDYYEVRAKNNAATIHVNRIDDSILNLDWTGSGGDKDFLIVVAVIGVVVVAALVVYSVSYLATMAANGFDCKAWTDFGFRYSRITDSNETQIRDGHLNAIYYSMGYRIPLGLVGLTGELGTHQIDIEVLPASQALEIDGQYLMLGPSFTIPFGRLTGPAFQIELLAGTSTEDEIGLMSTMRLGLSLPLSPNFKLGLNFGAALIDIKDFDNYISDRDDLNYLTGLSAAYRW